MIPSKALDLDAYLERLNYAGSLAPTEDCLRTLGRAQYQAIPFENFDILLGRGISLNPAALFNKLVHRARGGYCFELNGLLLMALKAVGFNARALLARVHLTGTPTGRGHQLSLITLNGRQWIADVGFGAPHLAEAIPLEANRKTIHNGQPFRLVETIPFGIMLQAFRDDQWQDLYSFELSHVCPADIAYGNHFTSTHCDSFFTYSRVASRPLPNGWVSLLDRSLKSVLGGVTQVRELPRGQAYIHALKTHFGIELDAPYEALGPFTGTDRVCQPVFHGHSKQT